MYPLIVSSGYVATKIGMSAIISTITTIKHTTSSIYDIMSSIPTFETPSTEKVTEHLRELDLEITIKVIEEMLHEIPKEKIHSKAVQICLNSLKQIVNQIETKLIKLRDVLKYNESLWILKSFRANDCKQTLNDLTKCKHVLDNRRKLLFELLQIKFDLKSEDIEMESHNVVIHDKNTVVSPEYFC